MRLYDHLRPYTESNGLGEALISPTDIEFSPRRLVQPDLFVVPMDGGRRPKTWRDISSLLLAVEVLSPSTARADRLRKRRIYQDEGVPEYWIVDLDARMVERWRPRDERPEFSSISSHGSLVPTLHRSRLVSKNCLRRSSSESRSRLFPIVDHDQASEFLSG